MTRYVAPMLSPNHLLNPSLDAGKHPHAALALPLNPNVHCQYVSSPIHTYCIGQACSMGSLLLAAGENGRRHCLPHASIMIHRESRTNVLSTKTEGRHLQNHLEARLGKRRILQFMRRRFCGCERFSPIFIRNTVRKKEKRWKIAWTDSVCTDKL